MRSAATEPAALQPALVIGYGNTLRRDDGAGPQVVTQVEQALGAQGAAACLVAHQLMPEMAEAVSRAQRVVFVDATVHVPAGRVAVSRLTGGGANTARLGHHLTPEVVLALAEALYGHRPQAWTVGIGVGSLDVGETLSPPVAQTVARLARRLARCVVNWSLPAAPH